jgi:hypothetical protein
MRLTEIFSKKIFMEQPKERLFGLDLVKALTLVVSLPFFISLGIVLFSASKLSLQLDIDGLNYFFLEAMRVPNSIFLVYLALLGLIASNHRSEQSKEQLMTVNSQNNFVNYYKHLEEFEHYSSRIPNNNLQKSKFSAQQHLRLFPESRKGIYKINGDIAGKLDNLAIKFSTFLPDIISHLLEKNKDTLAIELKESFSSVLNFVGLTSHLQDKMEIPDKRNPFTHGIDHKDFIRRYLDCIINANYLLEFDPEYVPSEIVITAIEKLTRLLSQMDGNRHDLLDITKTCCDAILAMEYNNPRELITS